MPRAGTKTLCLALLALTVVAYLPVWNNGFVDFDDELYISSNPHVIGGLTAGNVRWAWTNLRGNYWQPVTWMSLQLDAHCFSRRGPGGETVLAPAAFHGQNLFWHSASVLLLFALLRRLTGAGGRSFLVAALFAVHPMHVESVAWAVERKDVLSGFFGLLALWAYVRYLEEPGRKRYAAVLAAFLLSLLAKPMLLTLPFVLLLLDYWPLRRFGPAGSVGAAGPAPARAPLRALVWEKLPLFAVAAAIAIVTSVARHRVGAAIPLDQLPLSARLANAAAAYGWYVGRTFWPANLAAFYPHPHRDWSVVSVAAGVAVFVSLTLLALGQARRRPWLTFGWLWFAGTLVPVLGLAQGGEQAWADRFTYWPHVGLFVAVVWGLAEIAARLRLPAPAAATTAGAILFALGTLTWHQVGYWRDTPTLWGRVLVVKPDCSRARLNLGKYHLERGRPDEAEADFAEVVRLRPDQANGRYSLGVALMALGEWAEAAGQFRAALELEPGSADSWHNLGMARLNEGKAGAAVRDLRRALELEPDSADARTALGRALWRHGERDEAVRYFEEALRIDPRDAWAWHGLGTAYLAGGQPDKAADAFRRAVRFNPLLPNAHSGLGLALGRQNDWSGAAAAHLAALRLQEEIDRRFARMNRPAPQVGGVGRSALYRCRLAFALKRMGDPAADAYRDPLSSGGAAESGDDCLPPDS